MNDFFLTLILLGSMSSVGPLPFWATANRYGLMPDASGGVALMQAGMPYDPSKTLQWHWGTALAADVDSYHPAGTGSGAYANVSVNELYAGLKWKCLSLDLGAMRRDRFFHASNGMPALGSLSVTGGRMAWSGNARPVPGYTLTLHPLAVPFTAGKMEIFGSYGDYVLLDQRFNANALLHSMQAGVKFYFGSKVSVSAGLDHYALWGGTHPEHGPMARNLANYVRMALGMHGTQSATQSDRINVLGEQNGAEFLRVDWLVSPEWKLTAQHEIPYNDKSGMRFQNFPDGVNTLHLSRRQDPSAWITDLLYEYHYTMWQSGTRHERPTTEEERANLDPSDQFRYWNHILGGVDDYFNNGEYRTAWTYFGRTIGTPLFFPVGTHAGTWDPSGVTLGVENNRIRAHHFAVAGNLFRRAPYRLMVTYGRHYGTYKAPYKGKSQWKEEWGTVKETPLRQLSLCLDGGVPVRAGSRLSILWGLYADRGELLPDNFGATLGLRWRVY